MPDKPFNRSDEDANLQDFASLLGKKDALKLHAFFSSHKIPVGLTDEEARICVALYPLREKYVEKHNKTLAELCKPPPPVPEALTYRGEEMTRERFKQGIYEFLVQVSKP